MANNEKAIEALLEKGRASGKLTTTEINEAIEKLDLELDQMDYISEQCKELNIEIIEDYTPDTSLDLGTSGSQEEMEMSLYAEGITVDDPVKIYLKEIGRVPLLTADEEIVLAKKMKEGSISKKRLST
ncbi:MAG: RNA polymerase sigma factor RpoD, partial [Oscillospiraceae bacterium]|nr:RNA polymerase sigma factor RpoD [Oscillospiraceae bacterium]